MQTFADLGVSDAVAGALARRGITAPFAIQSRIMADALDGRDVLVKSPTGSGKTLAFGIPIAESIDAGGPRPAALILAPTRELAAQIVEEIRGVASARSLRTSAVYGGVGLVKQAREAARSHIVVATPGRLEDQLARGAFTLDGVGILVLDEADRMLDMGFRPAVERIIAACPGERQTLFLSATLDGETGRLARRHTRDARLHEHGPSARRAAAEVEHRFVPTPADGRVETLVEQLAGERDLALVFVRTKHGADRLVKRLDRHGVRAVAMHGNKSQRQREQALARFESGAVDTLVATDVAARGIDVGGISHVINYELPHDGDTYVHRVGRTGRAGRSGVGITLVADAERRIARQIAAGLGIAHGLGDGDPSRGAGRGPAQQGRSSGHPGRRPTRRRRSRAHN
ncbi:MAG: DEAD/DEAH box helicase [Acidobacteriota bacterium]|nr:DEAD/DEAH box helicase [Acidobacteriota bacterium]